MKQDNKMLLNDVLEIAKCLCESTTREEYEVSCIKVVLIDNKKPKNYLSIILHKKSDKEDVIKEVLKNNNKSKKRFKINQKYCHITTFEEGLNKDYISFDKNDEYPIKAQINDSYNYLEYFFEQSIRYRNDMMRPCAIIKNEETLSDSTSSKEKVLSRSKLK